MHFSLSAIFCKYTPSRGVTFYSLGSLLDHTTNDIYRGYRQDDPRMRAGPLVNAFMDGTLDEPDDTGINNFILQQYLDRRFKCLYITFR